MLNNVLLKSLRDQRRALLWWGGGLVALAVLIVLFYPSVRDASSEIQAYVDKLPEELLGLFGGENIDYTSPEGYLNSELFFFMVPLLFLIHVVTMGSGAIASEENRGTLEFLLSNPVARWRVVLDKHAAIVVGTLALALVFWIVLAIGSAAIEMGISFVRIAEATLSAALLGLAFGTLAFALGCATGNRGLSVGVTSAIAVASYFVNALGHFVDWLEPIRNVSPFYYYIGADPLVNGLNLLHAAVLVAIVLVSLAVALVTFQSRDLAT